MKKITVVLLSVFVLISCTEAQVLSPLTHEYVRFLKNHIALIGKITNIEKDENQEQNSNIQYSYLDIDITEILYTDLDYNESTIKVLYSGDLAKQLYEMSTLSYGYCDTIGLDSSKCIVTDLELYKDITYKENQTNNGKYDFEITSLDNINDVNILFYIRADFDEFKSTKQDAFLWYGYNDYNVKPTYSQYYSGQTKLISLDGKDWHYDETKSYKEQSDSHVTSRLSSLFENINRKTTTNK